eukprot:GEMP01021640.1.p1 GENE.GEMP01021640.1~~GEMP01021640.1.p1  ORF type:complete len:655 (+),score=78.73 GEMP01021640.1:79-1965(+)
MGTLTITSAQGFLAQLKETEPFVRQVALDRLLDVVDHFWAEIADCLTDIEACYEDPSFPHRNAAALLASRVYYHLEEYGDSLRLALEAGDLFVLRVKTEFVETIVTKAIDEYIRMKTDPKQPTINPKLENVVERMFKQCLDEKEFKQGLGIAIECRRLDRVHDFILATPDVFETVQYCMDLAPRLNSRSFRMDFFKMLKGIFRGLGSDNLQIYPGLCQCLFVLDDSDGMAEILKSLLDKGTAQGRLLAFQIAFDLNENENQEFLRRLRNHEHLKVSEEPLSPLPPGPVHVIQTPSAVNGNPPPGSTVVTTAPDEGPSESVPLLADPEPEAPAADVEMEGAPEPEEPDENTRVLRLLNKILSGRATIDANLAFLYRKNHTDLLLLDNIKASVDQRNSVVRLQVPEPLVAVGPEATASRQPRRKMTRCLAGYGGFEIVDGPCDAISVEDDGTTTTQTSIHLQVTSDDGTVKCDAVVYTHGHDKVKNAFQLIAVNQTVTPDSTPDPYQITGCLLLPCVGIITSGIDSCTGSTFGYWPAHPLFTNISLLSRIQRPRNGSMHNVSMRPVAAGISKVEKGKENEIYPIVSSIKTQFESEACDDDESDTYIMHQLDVSNSTLVMAGLYGLQHVSD